MNPSIQDLVAELAAFNTGIRHRWYLADCLVPGINDMLALMAGLGLLTDTVLLGEVICDRSYAYPPLDHESGQVVQAALLVPGGLGVVVWDSEEYVEYSRNPSRPDFDVRARFRPYRQCGQALRALILPHIAMALEHACCRLRAIASQATSPQ